MEIDWRLPENPPTEAMLFFEIAEYEERIAELEQPNGWREHALLVAFKARISYRKRLLAALREGRPEAWAEYEG